MSFDEKDYLIQQKDPGRSLDDLLEDICGNGLDLNGKYTFQQTLKCGLANASDAVEIVAVSFVLTSVSADFNLSGFQEGALTAVIFAGMMIGGWSWGGLSDSWGRTKVLSYCLLMNAFFGLLSAFMPEYYSLLVCRFLSGVGVGGSIPVIFSYYSEFLPPSNRGALISLMAISWPVGALFVSLVAWALIPTTEDVGTPFDISWRLFLIPCSLPALTCSILFFTVSDESVKWLYYEKQNFAKCSDILRKIAKIHRVELNEKVWGSLSEEDLRELYEEEMAGRDSSLHQEESSDYEELLRKTLLLLFSKDYAKLTWIQAVIWFSLSFAFYGCYEFLPSYFETLTDAESSGAVNPYLSSVISSVAQFPGVILTAYFLHQENFRVDRSWILAGSMLASCICLLFGGVFTIDGGWAVVIFMSSFSGASVLGWTVLNVVTTELAPTAVRSSSYGLLCAIGRVGAIAGTLLFGVFSQESFFVPMLISSAFLLLGAVFGMLLPSMKGQAMH